MFNRIGEKISHLKKLLCHTEPAGYEKKNYEKANNHAPAFPVMIKERYHICPNCGAYVWFYDGRCKRCQQLLDWSKLQNP
jgi:predicted RNA-binding Zn-ribbon protein involved in translation (DUF1610 family)